MCVEQIKMILADNIMDLSFPTSPFQRKSFESASYSKWASAELFRYILEQIYPKTEVNVRELVEIVERFVKKMDSYSKRSEKTEGIFRTASDFARNMADIFLAME